MMRNLQPKHHILHFHSEKQSQWTSRHLAQLRREYIKTTRLHNDKQQIQKLDQETNQHDSKHSIANATQRNNNRKSNNAEGKLPHANKRCAMHLQNTRSKNTPAKSQKHIGEIKLEHMTHEEKWQAIEDNIARILIKTYHKITPRNKRQR